MRVKNSEVSCPQKVGLCYLKEGGRGLNRLASRCGGDLAVVPLDSICRHRPELKVVTLNSSASLLSLRIANSGWKFWLVYRRDVLELLKGYAYKVDWQNCTVSIAEYGYDSNITRSFLLTLLCHWVLLAARFIIGFNKNRRFCTRSKSKKCVKQKTQDFWRTAFAI